MSSPLVSMIVATRNRADLLPRAVESLLRQTVDDLEVIIVDDGSTDTTTDVVNELQATDPRVRSRSNSTPLGPSAARNRGIEIARGQFIGVLDDDDQSVPGRLEIELEAFRAAPSTDIVCGPAEWLNDHGEPFYVFPREMAAGEFPTEPDEVFVHLFVGGNRIVNTTVLARRQIFNEHRFAEDMRISEDWLLWCQLAAIGKRFATVRSVLTSIDRGSDREGLMRDGEVARQFQREAIRRVDHWLRLQDRPDLQKYTRGALANQLALESRQLGSWRGAARAAHALVLSPHGSGPRDALTKFWSGALERKPLRLPRTNAAPLDAAPPSRPPRGCASQDSRTAE